VFSFFKKKKNKSADEQLAAVIEELVNVSESEKLDEENLLDAVEAKELVNEIKSEAVMENFIDENIPAASENTAVIIEDSAALSHGFEATYLADVNLEQDTDLSPKVRHEVEEIQEELQPLRKLSWTERLKQGLSKTRDAFGKKLLGVFGGGKIDEDLYDELESILLTSDVGVAATMHLLDDVRKKVSLRGLKDGSELKKALADSLGEMLAPIEQPLVTDEHTPFVIMMVGVNGAGKTTSIGKLAKYFQQQGKSVMLAAGDTFRAAAREQLIEWGNRNNITVIAQQSGDSAAVCYDAIQSAVAKKIDIVLADTAGRLPTQLNLMAEIQKVKRVINKALPNAPHEIMLVLDANIGQNAMNQVKAFDEALGLTGLVLTKLDGTAKGGIICAIAKEHPIPLRFIGVGESIDDLRPFVAKDYVNALLD
jgi:fused signal recognition particle receptor